MILVNTLLKQQLSVFDIVNFAIVGDVDLRCIPFADDFLTLSSFSVTCSMYGLPQTLNTTASMTTDLASVPRPAWSAVPPHRRIKRPAVFHDDIYQNRPYVNTPQGPRRIQRNEADALLCAGCIYEGLSEDEYLAVYEAVRIGGSSIWHSRDQRFA